MFTLKLISGSHWPVSVDARAAGEGNLEILVQSSSGQSLPTEVEAIGGNEAVFGVSFTPLETILEESRSQMSSMLSSLNAASTSSGLGGQGHSLPPSSTATVVQPHLIYVTFNDDNVPGNYNIRIMLSLFNTTHLILSQASSPTILNYFAWCSVVSGRFWQWLVNT